MPKKAYPASRTRGFDSPEAEIADWHAKFDNKLKGTSYGNNVENSIRAKHRGEPHWADKLVSTRKSAVTKEGIRKWADDQEE